MTSNDRQDGTLLAAIGYLPALFFVPLVVGRGDPFCGFHGRQSLALIASLIALQVVIWLSDLILGRILGSVLIVGLVFRALSWIVHYPVGLVIAVCYVVAVVVGMVQAASGKYWRIPVLGAYVDRMGSRETAA